MEASPAIRNESPPSPSFLPHHVSNISVPTTASKSTNSPNIHSPTSRIPPGAPHASRKIPLPSVRKGPSSRTGTGAGSEIKVGKGKELPFLEVRGAKPERDDEERSESRTSILMGRKRGKAGNPPKPVAPPSNTIRTVADLATPSPVSSSTDDDDEVAADEEMMQYTKRQQARKIAHGVKKEELDDTRFPDSIVPAPACTPASLLRSGQASYLSAYEKSEVLDFHKVYYIGTHGEKTQATPEVTYCNYGYDDERGDYIVVTGDQLAYRYEIVDLLGKGAFGQVLQCRDHATGESVAVKIIRNKKRFHQQALVEIKILENMKNWDPDHKHHVVRIHEHFYFRGHLCIVMELLSTSLHELIKANQSAGFSTVLIRRFTTQILGSLVLMRLHRVVHCDLKPENVLLRHPAKSGLKVIDFGSSCFEHEKVYTYIQSRFYRSPEVILGLNYHMAIDMWSLGCILAELYTGYPIFPGENEQEQLACIMEVLGLPDKEIIARSPRKNLFFGRTGVPHPVVNSRGRRRRAGTRPLAQVLRCDEENFIDFIAKCLHWDPERRLKPRSALWHPFITAGRHRTLPVISAPASSSRSLLTSSSSSRMKGSTLETPRKTQIGAPMPLAARGFGNPLTPGPSVLPIDDTPTRATISQSPPHRTLRHTDGTSGNPRESDDSSDSTHSQGDSSVETEDDEVVYMSSPYLRELLGPGGCLVHSIQGREAAELGSKLHLHLRNCSTDPREYTAALKHLQDLCSSSGELPSSYRLENVTFDRGDVIGRGGEASVYRGKFDGQEIVVREVVMPRSSWRLPAGQRVARLIQREVITHAQLDHPNIIHLLGVFYDNLEAPPMMVLPLVEKGALTDLIVTEVIQGVEYAWIAIGIGRALTYLHQRKPPIYHGDIHLGNVLIDCFGNALLCDFGLSRIRHEVTRTFTIIREGGRVRFLAPELLRGEEKFRTTPASDIFSLSMAFLNIWTREAPFAELASSWKVEAAIRKGRRPEKPAAHLDLPPEMEQEFWSLLTEMWAHDPARRPPSDDMQRRLEAIFAPLLKQRELNDYVE